MNFWDFVSFFFWSFVFIAYLMVLFSVLSDIFRDHELSGWLKALWVILLIFVPFLTALIYLIARGSGMARRQAETMARSREDTDSYIRSVAGSSPADEIAQAKALLDSGAISASEYEALKARAMGGSASTTRV
ncbi:MULTISPECIES: SHOCT domain-containing protein [unclassified Diaminobutyricimonas]|uniref:SHOCT domain-containing protein n=1 Tax=unclassified Diaminobutyricimonas TaxID=2643261 RepID=UPI0012F47CA7|nr:MULTISPECIES: SHOCT domain-containing protein [unclassified Diaminobutyricimonas]